MEGQSTHKRRLLLPVFYLGPVGYFAVFQRSFKMCLELHEHYVKQTYRNHCLIYGANGPLRLTVPVVHTGKHVKMKDVRISYGYNWQKLHWQSLVSAYRSSPFFEFYEDAFAPFYHSKFNFLCDFNEQLIRAVLEMMHLPTEFTYTTEYTERFDGEDLRSAPFHLSNHEQYPQVFADKHGFLPNLSILDLLFNMGNEAGAYIAD